MEILVLTSKPHFDFVVSAISALDSQESWNISYDPKHDFSDGYDIGISFMYQHKIPKEQLSKTWINFHPGPLPKYKGRNLCYHALMNGEEYFGSSVHYMDEGFDTGDIIDVWQFPILPFDTAQSLSDMALQTSQEQFVEYLPRIAAGEEFARIPNVGGDYYKKEPVDEFINLPEYSFDYKKMKQQIRAITYGNFYPKIDIGGEIYKVVKE